jgi:hypothetical protein
MKQMRAMCQSVVAKAVNGANASNPSNSNSKSQIICWRCNKVGHKADSCWAAVDSKKGKGKGKGKKGKNGKNQAKKSGAKK